MVVLGELTAYDDSFRDTGCISRGVSKFKCDFENDDSGTTDRVDSKQAANNRSAGLCDRSHAA